MPKSSDRVRAYGDVDELSSVLGALIASLGAGDAELVDELRSIQSELLHIGAWLATAPNAPSTEQLEKIGERQIKSLEAAIDRMEEGLPPLKGFVLPGGHVSASWAHVARAVCRRAERQVVELALNIGGEEASDPLQPLVTYLNRLSDYLFVLGRTLNRLKGVPDILWKK